VFPSLWSQALKWKMNNARPKTRESSRAVYATLMGAATLLIGMEVYGFRASGDVGSGYPRQILLIAAGVALVVYVAGMVRRHAVSRRRADEQVRRYTAYLEAANHALEEAAFAAQAASRAKSEFLANISHEIRTPMTAILGYLELIAKDCPRQCAFGHNEIAEHIAAVKRNSDYLLALIDNILDISKIEAGRMGIEQATCSPGRIVAEVVALTRPRAASKGLDVEIRYAGRIPERINSDPTRLRQILFNLLGNAVKFTECGKVCVTVGPVHYGDGTPRLEFQVADTGIGMSEDEIAKLFQPFSQADSSTTRRFSGTGLGLTICKRLAELLGGDISVTSRPGEGSTFTFTVATGSLEGVKWLDDPAEADFALPPEKPEPPRQTPTLDGRVLLVEDGPDNQRIISFFLRTAGAEVTVAENGQVALESFREALVDGRPFDVILMDMQMPVLDGYQTTRQFREEGHTLPIIALTAHAMSEDRRRCLEAGCDDYMTKPLDRAKLISLVARHLTAADKQFA